MSDNDEPCSGCTQKHDCKSIYRTIGHAEVPSVVWKVVFVFLVPITVFVISIIGFGNLLKERIASEWIRTAATFVLAVLVGGVAAGVIRWLVGAWSRPGDAEHDRKRANGNTRETNI